MAYEKDVGNMCVLVETLKAVDPASLLADGCDWGYFLVGRVRH